MLGGSGWSGGRREVGRREVGRREREGLSVNCQEGRMREGERERGREREGEGPLCLA